MKSLTTVFLLTAVLGLVRSAGPGCKYVETVTDNSKEWNYKLGGGEWTCGDCTSVAAQ